MLRPTQRIGNAVVCLLAAQVVVAAFEAAWLIYRLSLQRLRASLLISRDQLDSADHTISTAAGIGGLLFIATVVVWCMWQHRAQQNAIELTNGGLRFTPGWAVGWWFIPIMNVFRPFQTVRELWAASHGGGVWRTIATWPVIGLWWACFLLSDVHLWFGSGEAGVGFGAQTVQQPLTTAGMISRDRWMLVSIALDIVAAILAILIVRAVGRLQASARVSRAHVIPAVVGGPMPDLPAPPPA